MEEWIEVGIIFRKHGVHGDVKVYPLTDSPRRFLKLHQVQVETRSKGRYSLRIDRVRFQKDRVILHFEGKDTPEAVEPLLKSRILIPRSDALPLPEGHYYCADMIGLEVFAETGEYLGTVTDIFATGSNDVYVVRREGKEVLIPAIREVIRKVDLENRKLMIHLMRGLLG